MLNICLLSGFILLYVIISVPKICHDKRDRFVYLLSILDGLNISAQHYKEDVADEIRKTKSQYDRQAFYNSLPYKEKIRINLNIVKPYLYTKEDLTACLKHYDAMGFNSIKLSEIQHGKDYYVSFEKTFGIKLGCFSASSFLNCSSDFRFLLFIIFKTSMRLNFAQFGQPRPRGTSLASLTSQS